jgi:hypothetical protein
MRGEQSKTMLTAAKINKYETKHKIQQQYGYLIYSWTFWHNNVSGAEKWKIWRIKEAYRKNNYLNKETNNHRLIIKNV